MEKLKWNTEKRHLIDLVEYEKNPRKINEKQKKELKKSLKKFGLAEIPAIDIDNTLIAGHQRCKILLELKGPNFEIDVRVPNRKLTEKEFKEYNIRSNKNTGDWDFDLLKSEFEKEDLLEWGFDEIDFENIDINNTVDDKYTKKIETPVYEITQQNAPELNELYDMNKTNELIDKINKIEIDDDIKDFLIKSSYRHIIFNYGKIAEFYAHAEKEIQELMEDSALIIIDFDKAIENGYVKLSEEIEKQYNKENE